MDEIYENYINEDIITEAEQAAIQILSEKYKDSYDKNYKVFEK